MEELVQVVVIRQDPDLMSGKRTSPHHGLLSLVAMGG
jgi:hypothetical protein